MVKLPLKSCAIGDIGCVIFKNFCKDRGYWYVKAEDVYRKLTLENKILFVKGYERREEKLPDSVADEMRRILTKYKHELNGTVSYVIDFFTMKVPTEYQESKYGKKQTFHAVEVKTNEGKLSTNQINCLLDLKQNGIINNWVFKIKTRIPEEPDITYEPI